MTGDVQRLVERIHESPQMAIIAVAGAGGQALAWLLGVPGASKTVLEATVPYGRLSMVRYLGREPAQFVSPETAKEMAESAYTRALDLREANEPVLGLACTGSIATDRTKRGEHRCYVSARDAAGVTTFELNLAKGERDRDGEEDVVSRLILWALAESCGIGPDLPLGLLDCEHLQVDRTSNADPLRRFLVPAGKEHWGGGRTLSVYADGRMGVDEPLRGTVLPGSFSPFHQGHEGLAQVASEIVGMEVVFEISVVNVDKPPLEEDEVRNRLRQFSGKWKVVLTRAPTFKEKAALFPGCTFVVGWDTAVRLVHPRYYGGEDKAMRAALSEIQSAGCRILVAGRGHEGVFRTLSDVDVPREFADLFEAIPESRFRVDMSSTELRSEQRTG